MKVVDTSSNTTDQVSCIASSGIETIIRYYASVESSKVLGLEEAQAISNAQMQIGVVFENGNSLDYFTEQNGYKDGESAYNYATDTIGQPYGSAIYFAADLNVTDIQIQTHILPYFLGVKTAFELMSGGESNFKIGAYACGAAVNNLKRSGLCQFRWLSESTSYNGTQQALQDGEYEMAQKYNNPGLKVCTISVDEDVLKVGVTDIGAFSISGDS